MSYITSNYTPYRSKNLWKEFLQILKDDYAWICNSLEGRGLMFAIAVVSLMSMSFIKAIVTIAEQVKKPLVTYDHLNLHRGMRDDTLTSILSHRERVEDIQNHDNFYSDEEKEQRVNAIASLRSYLYQHKFTLYVTTLKKINHRVSEEDLMQMYRTGEISKPISTTRVTFGDDLNRLLKEVLGDTINLKVDKITGETYVQITNDDFFPLRNSIEDLYNEKLTLKFD